jgi:hypothetical protein
MLQSLILTAATSIACPVDEVARLGVCPVSRYYFNLVGPKGVIVDPEGAEVSDNDFEEAIPRMLDEISRILEEIRADEPELFDIGGKWSLEVVDAQGHRVAIFPL